MKTITFYSYKGGVGRSLALSNVAIRLSQLKKKVCVIDFDLDAPGLRFKFPNYTPQKPITIGLVDYIHQYSDTGKTPNNIVDFVTEFESNDINAGPIQFISAGNIDSNEYWKKLSMIRWADMFYSEKGQGIRFFLDFKAKIEKDINPDVLLIDSRTGITDISGITLRLLADEIVVLAVNNKENIFGSKKILKSLFSANPLLKREPKVKFVLTRLPFTNKPSDKAKEYKLIQERKLELKEELGLINFDVSVIHSDKRLEENESHLIGIDYDDNAASISNDYLKLFDSLTADILDQNEIEEFKRLELAEVEFGKALMESDLAKRLILLNNAIGLNSGRHQYYKERGEIYATLENYSKAIADFKSALKLNKSDVSAKYYLAWLHVQLEDFDKAEELLEELIPILEMAIVLKIMVLKARSRVHEAIPLLNEAMKKHLSSSILLNARADIYRILNQNDEALKDIFKAIELDPNEPYLFGTLAEIYANLGQIEQFYLNLTIAASKGLTSKMMYDAKEVYIRFIKDERFLDLMARYQIDVNEVFHKNIQTMS